MTLYDVFKVGSRYQVIRVADNTPMGKTFASRAEAWEYIGELNAEESGEKMFGPRKKATPEQAAGNVVEMTVAKAKTTPQGTPVGAKSNVSYGKSDAYR